MCIQRKGDFLLLRAAFHVLSLAKPFPCALPSLPVPRGTASLRTLRGQVTELGRGQEAALPPLIPTRTRPRDPSHPCEAQGPHLPPRSPFLLLFKLQHRPSLQTSVLPSSPAPSSPLHLAGFVARLFSSVTPLTFTRAPALHLSSCLTAPL